MLDTDRVQPAVSAEDAAAPAPSAPIAVDGVGVSGTDIVYLAPKLTVPMGTAAFSVLEGTPRAIASVQAILTSVYLSPPPVGGIVAWTFVEDDELVAITAENIARLLPWDGGGMEVAEKANELYAGDLFRPLERRRQSLQAMRTGASMSPRNGTGQKPRKRSGRSLLNGTGGKPSGVPGR